jgi:hypothetical protein
MGLCSLLQDELFLFVDTARLKPGCESHALALNRVKILPNPAASSNTPSISYLLFRLKSYLDRSRRVAVRSR